MRLSKILGFADNDIGKLAKLYLEEASTIKEIKSKLNNIFLKNLHLKVLNKRVKLSKKR